VISEQGQPSEGRPEVYDSGMAVEKGNIADKSMGDTSGDKNETHDEDDDSEDEEALVVVSTALSIWKTRK
jgi:hypothetical protein